MLLSMRSFASLRMTLKAARPASPLRDRPAHPRAYTARPAPRDIRGAESRVNHSTAAGPVALTPSPSRAPRPPLPRGGEGSRAFLPWREKGPGTSALRGDEGDVCRLSAPDAVGGERPSSGWTRPGGQYNCPLWPARRGCVVAEIEWDGTRLPEELRQLPPGRYILALVDDGDALSDDEDAAVRRGLDELTAGRMLPLDEAVRGIRARARPE